MDDTQGNIPSALAEKPDELLRIPFRRASENSVNAKFAQSIFYSVLQKY